MITLARHIKLQSLIRINIILLIICISLGCKDDKLSNQTGSTEEEIFLDDYKSTPFKWGYINTKGNIIIDAIYDDNRDFSQGLAAANYKGKWGYINTKGETIIDFKYRTTTEFSEGLAVVQLFDRQYLTINTKGEVISKAYYEEQYPYKNGRSRVKLDGRYGYVNADGIRIDTTIYLKASNFENGTAIVKTINGYQVIGQKMQSLTSDIYDKIYKGESRYWKYRLRGKFGYLDTESKFEHWNDQLDDAGSFEDGIACIKIKEISYILDENGNKNEVPYSSLRNLSHNRIAFLNKGKYGVIDQKGNIITPEIYNGLYKYEDNRLGYQKGQLWGYLDLNGKEITPPLFPLVWDYKDGLARAISSSGIGFIDTIGRPVIPQIFMEVRDFNEGLARVQVYR